jgi:hypothetical protein
MPIFKGKAGGFQNEKAIQKRLKSVLAIFWVSAGCFLLIGYLTGKGNPYWLLLAVALGALGFKPLDKYLDKYMRLIRNEEDGADGEREFLKFLKHLPDTYTVISDLDFPDSYGNIDYLIIGPNGVFAIDVKNWRGVVMPDGKGELLVNGVPTEKPQVRRFTRRVMELKDRIKALANLDPYVQCVFAFLRTRVDANWGETGPVHCIRAEQISEYVMNGRGLKPVPTADIPRLIDAVEALRRFAQPGGEMTMRGD